MRDETLWWRIGSRGEVFSIPAYQGACASAGDFLSEFEARRTAIRILKFHHSRLECELESVAQLVQDSERELRKLNRTLELV